MDEKEPVDSFQKKDGKSGEEDLQVYPWDRLEEEPNNWYDKFHIYLLLGAGRTIRRAWRDYCHGDPTIKTKPDEKTPAPSKWFEMAERFEWKKRAIAFDDFRRTQEVKETIHRRIQLREELWGFTLKLVDQAKQMLAFPLQTKKIIRNDNGTPIKIIIKPTKWGIGDIIRAVEASAKLGQIATDTDIQKLEVSLKGEVPVTNKALANMEWLKEFTKKEPEKGGVENGTTTTADNKVS